MIKKKLGKSARKLGGGQENTICSNMVIEELMIKKTGRRAQKRRRKAHTRKEIIKEINVSKCLRRKM